MVGSSSIRALVAFLSLGAFCSSVLAYLWWGKFQYHHRTWLTLTYLVAVALVAGNHLFQRDSRKRLGFRVDNFADALRWYGAATLIAAALITSLGYLYGSIRVDHWSDLAEYAVWAIAQHYVLQNFLRLRNEDVWSALIEHARGYKVRLGQVGMLSAGISGRKSDHAKAGRYDGIGLLPRAMAVLVAALMFALLHWPNPALVLVAFLGGLLWCLLYAFYPNFLCGATSQAGLSVLLVLFFKYQGLDQLSVGAPGYRYEAYGTGVQVAAGYDGSGSPVIVTVPGPDKGREARVRVFTSSGQKLSEWTPFPALDFSANLAVGDLGFGPGDEVAVTPGPGLENPPGVAIYDLRGHLLHQFSVPRLGEGYGANPSIFGGNLYLTPGPGPGYPQEVLKVLPEGRVLQRWTFPALPFSNGIQATAVSPSGPDAPREPSGGQERPFLLLWATVIPSNPSTLYVYDPGSRSLRSMDTLSTTFGLNLTPVNITGGFPGFAVAPGFLEGYPSWIKVFRISGQKVAEFVADPSAKVCGSDLAAVDVNGDGRDELVLGEGVGPGRPATVRVMSLDGTLIDQWNAYPELGQ